MNEAKSVNKWAASVAMAREFDSNPPIISPEKNNLMEKCRSTFYIAIAV